MRPIIYLFYLYWICLFGLSHPDSAQDIACLLIPICGYAPANSVYQQCPAGSYWGEHIMLPIHLGVEHLNAQSSFGPCGDKWVIFKVKAHL